MAPLVPLRSGPKERRISMWVIAISVLGYVVSREADRSVRWRMFAYAQILSAAIWFFEFLFTQLSWIKN